MLLYKIRITHNDFLVHAKKITCKNVLLDDYGVIFNTNLEGIKTLEKNCKVEVLSSYKKQIKTFIILKKGYLIGIILFLSIAFINNKRINKVTFNGDFPINEAIKEEIYSELTYFGPFAFYNKKLDELSLNLRSKYANYEWISLGKKGNKIEVNISNIDVKNIRDEDLINGDIIARKDGIVKYYVCYQGGVNIYHNKFVQKGDILFSSNKAISFSTDIVDLTEARGYCLAETYEEVNIDVPINVEEASFTGKIDRYQYLELFGIKINFNKKKSFANYELYEDEKWNFLDLLIYKNVQVKEKDDIITVYTNDEALEYATSIIKRDFQNSKTLENEKIMEIGLLSSKFSNASYQFTFLVKKLENIGEFIRRDYT